MSPLTAKRLCFFQLDFFFVARKADTAQRGTILPPCQRLTRRVRIRTPECGLLIRFVVTRQHRSDGESSSRLMVNISSPDIGSLTLLSFLR